MGRRAIIMDRDGTVCDELDRRDDVSALRLVPGSAAAIRSANERGFQTVLVTHQTELIEEELHDKVRELLDHEGARLDAIYCRPLGAFERARDEMGIDLAASYTIGDRVEDVEHGHRAGTTNVLVLTGKGQDELARQPEAWRVHPDHIAPDLRAAVAWILEREATR